MVQFWRHRITKNIVIFKMLAVLIVVFQNCSPAVDEGSLGGSSIGKLDKIGYDVKLDTLAYMSCSGSSLANVFSFKVGAYNTGSGLMYTSEYLVNNKDLPKTLLDENFTARVKNDPINGPVALQLSIRNAANPGTFDSSAGSETSYFLGRPEAFLLSHESLAIELRRLNTGERKRYFKSLPGIRGRLLESAITVNKTRAKAQSLRTALGGASQLFVSYRDAQGLSDASLIKAGTAEEPKYFGSVFNMTFSNTDRPQLTDVTERSAYDGSSKGTWDCRGDRSDPKGVRQFIIVKYEDQEKDPPVGEEKPCPRLTDSSQRTSANAARLKRVRDILDPTFSKWYINLAKTCITPKLPASNITCYSSTLQTPPAITYVGVCPGGEQCPYTFTVCEKL